LGDFRLVTFPGELTVQVGLNIQQASQIPQVFVSGYTNGYIYYCPTAEQLKNLGNAQEDSDCILDATWQEKFESVALKVIEAL
jgi:outer membrane usher protein FimD/PapC